MIEYNYIAVYNFEYSMSSIHPPPSARLMRGRNGTHPNATRGIEELKEREGNTRCFSGVCVCVCVCVRVCV